MFEHAGEVGARASAEARALLAAARAFAARGDTGDDEVLAADAELVLRALAAVQGAAGETLRRAAERDVADLAGRGSVTSWAASRPGGNPGEAAALLGLARAAARHPVTGTLWREGTISSAHARVVYRALRGLDAPLQAAGDAFLAEAARELLLPDLTVVAEAWRDTVTPEACAGERDDAAEAQFLTLSPTDGGLLLRGWLTGLNAAWLQASVDRLSRPVAHDQRDAGRRRADALGLLARVAAEADEEATATAGAPPLPAARVCVVADPVALQRAIAARDGAPRDVPGWVPDTVRELGRPAVDERTGAALTTAELLATLCDGGLARALLDASGAPLDLGMTRRLFSGPQRRALARGGRIACSWKRCGSPWVEAHHDRAWADGGPTDVANGRLLCGYHHSLIHLGWRITAGNRPVPPPDWHLRRRSPHRARQRGRPPEPGPADAGRPWGPVGRLGA